MNEAIFVENLSKKYSDLEAVRNVSFSVKNGTIFGLLGQNGAGKSTTISMLTCQRRHSVYARGGRNESAENNSLKLLKGGKWKRRDLNKLLILYKLYRVRWADADAIFAL